jgi:hypothetical protein
MLAIFTNGVVFAVIQSMSKVVTFYPDMGLKA